MNILLEKKGLWQILKNYRCSKRKWFWSSWWTNVRAKLVTPRKTQYSYHWCLWWLTPPPNHRRYCFLQDIQLPTAEDCIDVPSSVLIAKDFILQTEYEGQPRPLIAVYEVRSHVIGEHVAAYLILYGQILGCTSDNLNG